ncbi:hypothetical protein ACRALDRAFT_1081190 [Sodiomyces alcalophilus JCM 7366]|uniref:uncharacterized protein n=1 Tax=Sodiomyces alcalophilus JCM 7366 TaxID=591952 RepID=UPI0039B49B51
MPSPYLDISQTVSPSDPGSGLAIGIADIDITTASSSTTELYNPDVPPSPQRLRVPVSSTNTQLHPNAHANADANAYTHSRATSRTLPVPLPRTSSLLPPPHLVETPRALITSNASTPRPYLPSQANLPEIPIPRRSVSHSRSSSAGGNLNRWSVSTSSSKLSASNSRRSHRSGHRSSFDAATRFSHSTFTSAVQENSPRKLQKNRRGSSSAGSPASSTASHNHSRQASRSPTRHVPPPIGLPPIVTLPSLQQSLQEDVPSLCSVFNRPPPDPFLTPNSEDTTSLAGTANKLHHHPLTHVAEERHRVTPESSFRSDRPATRFPNTMPHNPPREPLPGNGYPHHRTHAAKGPGNVTTSAKTKDRVRPPSQKTMVSRALQRAKTAVQLDNAQNFEGARESYAEACELLAQVLARTATEEDKEKLEGIRQTYASRIEELDQMDLMYAHDDKELPARPESYGLQPGPVLQMNDEDTDEMAIVETATLARISRIDDVGQSPHTGPPDWSSGYPVRGLARTAGSDDLKYGLPRRNPGQYPLQSSFSRSLARDPAADDHFIFQRPAEDAYVPPLFPRQTNQRTSPETIAQAGFPETHVDSTYGHERAMSIESNSWLDPIDESGDSAASSVHSRTSSLGYRRRNLRASSNATEAEFDAALDAAVEAAYSDGFEPMMHSEPGPSASDDDVVARALRRVELAKERVRQTERETMELAEETQRLRQLQQRKDSDTVLREDFYDDGSSEDEELILQEMTRALGEDDGPTPDSGDGSAAASRQSDTSQFTETTWNSSHWNSPHGLSATPSATTITTIATSIADSLPPPGKPPSKPPPQPPLKPPAVAPGRRSPVSSQTVRNRRLSGQNPKQLKIDTGNPEKLLVTSTAAGLGITDPLPEVQDEEEDPLAGRRYSGESEISPSQLVPPSPTLPESAPQDEDDFANSRSSSPVAFPPALRNNYSSSSLRSLRSRTLSQSNGDDASDGSPGTPLSSGFGVSSSGRPPNMPVVATPLQGSFREKLFSAGGLHLFDDSFHAPNSPGSPSPLFHDAPMPLEPCPTDYLLRPFWLMRCLYQTLVHPRGGYLSNKLFVPRDAWKVKGVKLRNVEDKIASCDYLTAALQKLAQVDTCDADAVLDEMQSLEGVLEQVQANLSRKLGMDVGVQGSGTLFKDASSSAEMEAAINVPRSASVSNKSSFSWRRLRSKNSNAGLGAAYNSGGGGVGGGLGGGGGKNVGLSESGGKESPGLETLPMTPHPTNRPPKRDVGSAQFTGPNANYMGSLARLFDAAQAVDQIARQVEDPGLRHADKTQVGLELCTRHAAEFFGFYICRFVLADIGTLLDKYVKRGSEWVVG